MFRIHTAVLGAQFKYRARCCERIFLPRTSQSLLTLTLLAHQTLLSLDAVARALVRRLVTRERLLEWETAAEAELGKSATPIDRYIDWMPFLAVGLGVLIWFTRHHAFWAAAPVLFVGVQQTSGALAEREPTRTGAGNYTRRIWLLRKSALYIWRYFAEFSNENRTGWCLTTSRIASEDRCQHISDECWSAAERATGGSRVWISDGA